MTLLKNDTCSWIRGHLPTGTCDLTQLAARLNCDKRTLQRRFGCTPRDWTRLAITT